MNLFSDKTQKVQDLLTLDRAADPVQLDFCRQLVATGRHEEAAPILYRLYKQTPRDIGVLMELFKVCQAQDLFADAEAFLEQIFAINPDHEGALVKKERMLMQLGRFDEAEAAARRLLSVYPDHAKAYQTLSFVKRYQHADDADVTAMVALHKQSAPNSERRRAFCFVLGRVMEQLKLYDRAFAYLAEGNAIVHRQSVYNAGYERANMANIMAAYTPEVLTRTSAVDDPTPIFILGMPRCGSTLVEQILAAHPDVDSRGECDLFEGKALHAFHSEDNPLTLERLTSFTPEQWGELGETYLDLLKRANATPQRITDKTLSLFRMIGAIHCALPQAKIVHVRRQPLDTCLSIYKQDLEGAFHNYGYDLEELGHYYHMYLEMMQHWRDVLPAGVMYEMDYEELVADQEQESRKLLDYCGLPWDEACLAFDKAKNRVATSSVGQVRRGIYRDAMAAWKPYEKHLQPLIDALGPELVPEHVIAGRPEAPAQPEAPSKHVITLSHNKARKVRDMLAQAKQALAAGRFAPFEGLCQQIEQLQPGNPDVANLYGIANYKAGRRAEAENLFAAAIRAAPARAEFHNNLGALYLDQGRYAAAAQCYGEAIRLGEKSFPVRLCYCNALVQSGQFEQALPILKDLHKQKPRDTSVLMGLFLASDPLRLTEEAEGYLRQIIAIDPQHAEAHAKLGSLALQQGRMDEAEAEARKVLAILPGSPRAYDILTYARPYQDADDADIATMLELYGESAPNSADRRAMCFMLGRVMEQLGEYERAFPYFAEGNAIHRKLSRYRADLDLESMERIMAAHTVEAHAQTSGVKDATPIFVVGMPRCGSSLVEQILASHPDVESRGECDTFESKALRTDDGRMPTPEQVAAFTPTQWERIGLSYVQHLRGDDAASRRIVDKTLTNFRMLGAIHCALPKAKIVHVRRHPLDTCLSIYKLPLAGGRYGYGYDLGELGRYYEAYLRIMQHWRDTLPAGTIYELDYEQLVANQEQETRKLLDACGLPWRKACLQFTKAKNIVRTSSMAQVRRDIYTDSVAAWELYEKQLQPLVDILGTNPPNGG